MKRVTSSEELELHPAFEELSGLAYNVGYDLTVDSQYNMTLIATKDADHMPVITVSTIKSDTEDNVFYYEAKLKFPVLDSAKEGFYDSVHYWIENRWAEVGRLITDLCKFEFRPDDYED